MNEGNVIKFSVIASMLFVCLGIGVGVYSGADIIIFDGIYSLFSLVLSSLSYFVFKQVTQQEEDPRFPLGKAHFEPLVIVVKSLVLITFCLYSMSVAISSLMLGGRAISPGLPILYALVSTLGCLLVCLSIHIKNQGIFSQLLIVERNQWVADTGLSFGVLVGFILSYFLQHSQYNQFSSYIDPVMVIIASFIFLIMPFNTLIPGFKQMLFYRLEDDLSEPFKRLANKIANEIDAVYSLRAVVVGRELNLELGFQMRRDNIAVRLMDDIRIEVEELASSLYKQSWINITYTMNKDSV